MEAGTSGNFQWAAQDRRVLQPRSDPAHPKFMLQVPREAWGRSKRWDQLTPSFHKLANDSVREAKLLLDRQVQPVMKQHHADAQHVAGASRMDWVVDETGRRGDPLAIGKVTGSLSAQVDHDRLDPPSR